ncbi:MAG: ribosomal L7Ae/L30e/S12e/Gadd45 family protein [Tenericutes bacterium]|nr:ribosomal L7Ae/L30e/S12e/Gadd45 family protein [Mycoplasmatota bacterium]
MDKDKVLQSIGLCTRARMTASGEERVLDYIKSSRTKLVFLANDAGKNTTKRITDKSSFYKVHLNTDFNTDELNKAIGSINRKVIAIKDKNFTKMILSQLDK